MNRNTDTLLGNQYYTLAGPCTEMTLLETAVQAATDCASGRAIVSGVASAKGVALDKTTGMEARVMGETCMATCKLNLPKANQVINNILAKYEPNYKEAAQAGSKFAGKMFAEGCYDPVKILPTDAYLSTYATAMKTLEGCGLPLKGIY
jgi:methylamine--corrinoid protein Co-methyltransferase